jgi:beta-phosphoglucomutase-like phosphatase (HAD superfamily)
VTAAEATVFEDALSGVEAGHAGNFGFVVGVDRVGQAAALKQHGASIVVKDLAELL